MLIVAGYPAGAVEQAVICGPEGDSPPVHHDIEPSMAGRICAAVLTVISDLGLEPYSTPEPLPESTPDDVHQVCWQALTAIHT